jgi:hypothetical protein
MGASLRAVQRAAGLAAAAATLASCGDDLGIERERPNQPPDTRLTSSPPDSTYGTSYRVRLAWFGTDPDGAVDHYDILLVDHPAMDSCIECDPDDPSTVVVTPPAADDPRWTATGVNDTTIVTRADTLRVNPIPPDTVVTDPEVAEHNRLVRSQSFERWHTVFVRAVDERNAADPTPDYVSFNSKTLAPEVALLPPIDPRRAEFFCPPGVTFTWDGRDPVDGSAFIDPIASRWVVIRSLRNLAGYVSYPDSLYHVPAFGMGAPGRPAWSMWTRWDRADGLGRRATVRGLDPVGSAPGLGWYLFAVQAMDEAGAVTPVFDATTAGSNNVARVFVAASLGPTLFVDGGPLGAWTFAGGGRGISVTAAAGQPIRFRWRADATSYGGHIVTYRYGWNILDPDSDDEWRECGLCTETPPPLRVFESGIQRFFVEAIDNSGGSVRAEIEIEVHTLTRQRDLLLVDDTDNFPGDPLLQEQREDARWLGVIDSLRRRQSFTFDPVRDIYDVIARRSEPPPISLVFDYKTIVWCAKAAHRGPVLARVARFFDPFVERNRDLSGRFNFLEVYVESGGELWLSGQQPTSYLWWFGPTQLRPYPFNVTHWDDPITPHPQEDSVGVRSLLWRMGAETVDVGGGGQGQQRREGLEHFCIGFRRSMPPGSETQTFASAATAGHRHDLAIPTADVDQPPVAGVTHTTTVALAHVHTVTLSAGELRRLAGGEVVTVASSEAGEPVLHTHTFTLRDQVGLWGAPHALETERPDWAQPNDPVLNPSGGRPSVEIYNVPLGLAGGPPLRPDPRIWTPLYEYVSSMPVDPGAGVVYPLTADGQPAIILRKAAVTDRNYSRAFCGFEVWRLNRRSHVALADQILLRQFRLGLPE